MKRIPSTIPMLLACAVCVFGLSAHATVFGHIKAISSGSRLASGAAIAILPQPKDLETDTDPLYNVARAAIENALRKQGLRPDGNGLSTLKIEIYRPVFGQPRSRDGEDRSAYSPGGRPRPPDAVDQVRIPLHAREADSGSNISVSLMLYDSRGAPIWTATVTASGDAAHPEDVVRRISAEAAANIGTTVERDFLMPCEEAGSGRSRLCLD